MTINDMQLKEQERPSPLQQITLVILCISLCVIIAFTLAIATAPEALCPEQIKLLENAHVIDKWGEKNTYIIETNYGSYEADWGEYRRVRIGKNYDFRIWHDRILTIEGEYL